MRIVALIALLFLTACASTPSAKDGAACERKPVSGNPAAK